MQLMTWPISKLGSRFSLLFEPDHGRVMHSALGRFFDAPMDLAVGLIDPDGTEHVLPFTETGQPFYGCEQFERAGSITFRGHVPKHGLQFEFNIRSPFYPEDEQHSLLPVFFLEVRVSHQTPIRLRQNTTPPSKIKAFIRLKRPDTTVDVTPSQIDLSYGVRLDPRYVAACGNDKLSGSTDSIPADPNAPRVDVREQIVSLDSEAQVIEHAEGGMGLVLEMPVDPKSQGSKWRLIWGAYCGDPIMTVHGQPARLRYTAHWKDLDAVMSTAKTQRSSLLLRSRAFESELEQTPLIRATGHLMNLSFQSFCSNTFWLDLEGDEDYFGFWEGNYLYQNTLDVAYNLCLFYLSIWPDLMRKGLSDWAQHRVNHAPSGGLILHHDFGFGMTIGPQQGYGHLMPVEENSNWLLMMQVYAHWVGDTEILKRHVEDLEHVARYLLWTDRDGTGFPSEGTANTLDDAADSLQMARDQIYLAIKRTKALDAAADLLGRVGRDEISEQCKISAAEAVANIEKSTWLGDHYAVSIDRDTHGLFDTYSGQEMPTEQLRGWDDYSIYTSNGMLLPMLIAQPIAFDRERLRTDLQRAQIETLQPYGCGHTSSDQTNIWISSNIWRDLCGRYLRVELFDLGQRYWDMQVYSNTRDQSFGYSDTYIGNELVFNPRGVTSFGYLLGGPRLCIDRLDGCVVTVDPDRYRPQRWPLLPLADWATGRVPVCIVEADGRVWIDSETEPVKIVEPVSEGTIG
jgi:hypothetical protein